VGGDKWNKMLLKALLVWVEGLIYRLTLKIFKLLNKISKITFKRIEAKLIQNEGEKQQKNDANF
jgi:hypothetical protein